jgi:hypothetical protein
MVLGQPMLAGIHRTIASSNVISFKPFRAFEWATQFSFV